MRRAWLHLLDFSQQKPPGPSQLLQPLLMSDSLVSYCVCDLSLDSLRYDHISLVLGSPALGKALQVSLPRAHQRRITSPSLGLQAVLCIKETKRLLVFYATKIHIFSPFLLATWILKSYSNTIQSGQSVPYVFPQSRHPSAMRNSSAESLFFTSTKNYITTNYKHFLRHSHLFCSADKKSSFGTDC